MLKIDIELQLNLCYTLRILITKGQFEVKTKNQKMIMTAIFMALTCVLTLIIKIPSPFKGYINLGDVMVLLSGWLLSPIYGVLAAGIGSALADILAGYTIYAPITLVVKGIMALATSIIFNNTYEKIGKSISRTMSGITAEIIMVFGYFLFEGLLYGFGVSAVNIIANAVQGITCLILGLILVKILEKYRQF